MAKKSRKTRKEKQAPKKHEFNPWIVPRSMVKNEKTGGTQEERNKPQVPYYIFNDLKKITLLMIVFTVALVLLSLLAYYTNLLDPAFKLLNIKY